MIYLAIGIVSFFVLFVPLIPLGGGYYRSLLLVFCKDYLDSGVGFIKVFPDIPYLRLVRWADPISFRFLFGEYAKDRRYVYVDGYRIEGSDPRAVKRIATPFPIAIPFSTEHRPDFYYIDGKSVRCGSVLQLKVPFDGAEPENFALGSFEPLGGGFLRDKTGVYYTSRSDGDLSEQFRHAKYARTIFLAERLEIVDAQTFHLTELSTKRCSARDKTFDYNILHFTYGGMHTLAVDGVLEITKHHGQCEFQDLGSRYYLTESGIYFSQKRLPRVDVNTFEVISVRFNRHTYPYAKDSHSVFFMSRKLADADPKTFQIIPTAPYYSFDCDRRYSQGNDISKYQTSLAESENEKFERVLAAWRPDTGTN